MIRILLYFGSIWVRCICTYFLHLDVSLFTFVFGHIRVRYIKLLGSLEKKLFTMFTPGGQIKGKSMQPIREKARNC